MSLLLGPGLDGSRPAPPSPPETSQLWRAAQALEAGFLAEMLKSTDLGAASSEFDGGSDQGHFRSFLLQAQADRIVQSGGIGLAENLFQAMQRAAGHVDSGS